MHATLQQAGSQFVRSLILASGLMAVTSLPSFAMPQSSFASAQSGNSTASQVIVPYGQSSRQLFVIQRPTSPITPTAPLRIGRVGADGLPTSLEINYALGKQTATNVGGGGTANRTLPQFAFVPQGAPNGVGGELNAPIRSNPIQTYSIQSDQGFLDQTTMNVINFSF